jgi:hypothetical protein
MVTDSTAIRGIGYRAFHVAMMLVVVAAILVVAAGIGAGVWERVKPDERQSSVRLVSDGSNVSGASSLLTRGNGGIDFTLKTSGLPTAHVITLRAEIFNHPEKCAHGGKSMRCGAEDLADPAAGGSVVFLASVYLRGTKAVNFSGHLDSGDTSHAASGSGLTSPRGAAVHLIVMDHGPALQGAYGDQLSTLGAGCTKPPEGGGAPGPNECIDLQYASHE